MRSIFHENMCYLIILLSSLLSFICSYDGSFAFDDMEAILNNDDVNYNKSSIFNLFYHDFWGSNISSVNSHKSYRPLTVLSFRLNAWFNNGLDSKSFHFLNIVLHSTISILMYIFYSLIFDTLIKRKDDNLPFISALLFAVHPIHSENVSAIVGQADLLCCVFFLISFFIYFNYIKSSENFPFIKDAVYIFSFICVVSLSFLSKEQGITVLGICFVFEICYFHVLNNTLQDNIVIVRKLKLAFRLIFLIFLAIIFSIIRWNINGQAMPVFSKFENPHSFIDERFYRVLNYIYLYSMNVWLLLNPSKLSFDWSMGCVPIIESLFDLRIIFLISFIIFAFAILWRILFRWYYDDTRCLVFLISLMIIPFIPASNIFFRVGFVIAERNLYISSAGFVALIAMGLNKLLHYESKYFYSFVSWILLLYLCKSIMRSIDWRDEMTLYKSALNICPLNAKVHYNIAQIKSSNGYHNDAIKFYLMALRLNPEYDQAMNNLGNLYKMQGNLNEARILLRRAVSLKPSFATAWMNLGIVEMNLKEYSSSEISFKNALIHRSLYPDCIYNLGNMYMESGRQDLALSAWKKATQMNAKHINAWTNILILLDNNKNNEEMESMAVEALRHNPDAHSVHFQFANHLGKLSMFEKSEKHFLIALKLNPNDSSYLANIAVLYHRWNKLEMAEKYYKASLELEPQNSNTISNFNMLLKEINKY